MTDELYALFQAIATDPESQAPKLVTADYLEEHGDEEWAKFIRSECKAGPTVHAEPNESHNAIPRARFAKLRKLVANVEVVLGFPRRITMNVDQFVKHYEAANAMWPLVHVKIIKAKGRVDELAKCPHLARVPCLDFDFNKFNQAELKTLLASPHIRNVEELVLNNNPLGKAGTETLAAASLPKLRRLTATSAGITLPGAVALLSSRTLGKITHWNLACNPLTGDVAGQQTVPSHFADVEVLGLSGGVRDEIAALIATVDRPCKLRKLYFDGEHLGPGFTAFAASPHFPHLEQLEIGHLNEAGIPGLAKLCQSSAFAKLQMLGVAARVVNDDGLRAFVGDGLPSLRTLHVTQTWANLTGRQSFRAESRSGGLDGFGDFVRSPLLQRIESLNLRENWLGERGAKLLSQYVNTTQLKTVNLENTDLDPEALHDLVRSRWCPNLTKLNLSENKFTTAAWLHLAKAHHWKELRSLNLRQCNLGGGSEFTKFAQSPLLAGLERLVLSSNPLGDVAATALAASPAVGNLRELDLSSTNLTDNGITALAMSPHFHRLESLSVYSGGLTEVGVAQFLKAPHLPCLRTLLVQTNHFDIRFQTELRKRFDDRLFG